MKNLFFLILIVWFHDGNCLNQGSIVSQSSSRFIASVRLRVTDQKWFGNGFLCAGTLIDAWNVVTAASCVVKKNSSELQISLGSVDLKTRSVVINVLRISIHENFTESDPLVNNIAVLKLSSNIRHNRRRYNHIQPLGLAESWPRTQTSCPVFAWAEERRPLLQALLTTEDSNFCGDQSNGVFCERNETNSTLCGFGNIGGPFVCNNIFTGFVIDASACGASNKTGILQSVSHHSEWIRQVSGSNFSWKISSSILFFVLMTQLLL